MDLSVILRLLGLQGVISVGLESERGELRTFLFRPSRDCDSNEFVCYAYKIIKTPVLIEIETREYWIM